MIDALFGRAAASRQLPDLAAVIVPHAGYVYSGGVAASGFNQINRNNGYENVFIIGPSHYVDFEGASVYTSGNFQTPLGTVEVNRAIGRQLVASSALFSDRTDAQAREHSVEVELPFLQVVMKDHLRIVPIVVGANSAATCKQIADALRPYFNRRNLFVISSDFSHYPAYGDAVRTDSLTAAAILSNSPENLQRVLLQNDRAGIPNLATSLCGWSAVLTLLDLTSHDSGMKFAKIEYRNSGDSPVGDRGRVVGYCAITAYRTEGGQADDKAGLSKDDKNQLLAIARETLEHAIREGGLPEIDPLTLSPSLKAPGGAFVTLNKNDRLRGCIGRFDASEPLYKVVQEMAVAAATRDYRFDPVHRSELGNIRIEISVLTPMRKISSINEFDPDKDGIYMRKGARSGTFLPQVAKETGWTKEELLGHCAQDKAGIGWDGWKDAELFVYEAIVFGE